MKRTFKYALLALTTVAFTVPGCGTRMVPSSELDTGELKGGGKGKVAFDKSRPGKDKSAGTVKGTLGASGFRYGDDEAGKMLAQRLIPNRLPPVPPNGHATAPRPSAEAPLATDIDIPIPPNLAEPPHPENEHRATPLRPRSAPVELPLSWDRSDPELPARVVLPETGRARVPSVRSSQPPPLPPLGGPEPDRASVADPTAAFSIAAAAATVIPARTTKAPFVIFNLPDPFENRRAVRLRSAPAETELPLGTASSAPSK